MKFRNTRKLKDIAEFLHANYEGDPEFVITGINEIHQVEEGDITFVDHPKYYDKVLNSRASVIIINKEIDKPANKSLIFSSDPFDDYNKIVEFFSPFKPSNSLISESAKIGNNTIIQPNVFIGNNVIIGDNCTIHPNVSIYDNSIIGNNVTIHANTVIGSDAFYYQKRPDAYVKLKSCGRAIIEDNVDIGSNCSIDKGVSGDTIIGKGTKIDNLVQIAHDTVVGKNCLFASQVGIAGCVIIEDNVILWGQVGIQKDLTIGKGAVILGQSGVPKSLEGNKVYFGSPVQESKEKMRELAYVKRIPDIIKLLSDKYEG